MLRDLIHTIRYFIWKLSVHEPKNKELLDIFANVNEIRIKEEGVRGKKNLGKKVLLSITDSTKIEIFKLAIQIKDDNLDGMCCCEGQYAIELLSNRKVKAVFGLQHEKAIRYYKWDRDAFFQDSVKLIEFLNESGLKMNCE